MKSRPDDQESSYSFSPEQEVIFLGELNLLASNPLPAPTVHVLMSALNIAKFIPEGLNKIVIPDEDGMEKCYSISTRYSLGVREDNYQNIVCDVIDTSNNSVLGAGVFGSVYTVLGTLKYRYDEQPGYKFEAGEDKGVIKIGMENAELGQDYTGVNYIDRVNSETEKASETPHLRVREPLFGLSQNGKLVGGLPMRKIKGVTLHTMIEKLKLLPSDEKHNSLTMDDGFKIIIGLFKKLAEQIHAKGLIHRDIKPENIMIYRDQHGWHVNIIDMNLATTMEETVSCFAGTPDFADPSASNGESSRQTDIYAMSKSAYLLWQCLQFQENDGKSPYAASFNSSWKVVASILSRAMSDDLPNRLDLDQNIIVLENAYLSFRKETLIPRDQHANADTGLHAAIIARNKISDHYYLGNCLSTGSIDQFISDISIIIDSLPSNNFAIQEFINALGVKSLHGCQSKHDLLKKISHIFDKFNQHYSDVKKIYDELVGMLNSMKEETGEITPSFAKDIRHLELYTQQLGSFCHRILTTTPTVLDDVVAESDHLHRKFMKVKTAKQHFERSLSEKLHPNDGQSPHHLK